MSGHFIALEGPDGAGKSVQAARLAGRLRAPGAAMGRAVVLTREPGGTHLGEQVRAILLDPGPTPRSPEADALLFHAARSQLVRDLVRPALARGDIVVTDRFAYSTRAYQGYGSGVPLALLRGLEALSVGDTWPELVVLIDVPVRVGLARRGCGAPEEQTRFEDETRHDEAFHERVRAGYLEMAAADPARWRVIDGDRGADEVAAAVISAVEGYLRRSG